MSRSDCSDQVRPWSSEEPKPVDPNAGIDHGHQAIMRRIRANNDQIKSGGEGLWNDEAQLALQKGGIE